MVFANTQGQTLVNHSFAVGYLSYRLFDFLGIDDKRLAFAAFVVGVLHDIGKHDPVFRHWLSSKKIELDSDGEGVHIDIAKFSFEKYPRHNEISWLLASSLLQSTTVLHKAQIEQILHGIYFHHIKPCRKDTKFFDSGKGIAKLFLKGLEGSIDDFMTDIKRFIEEVRMVTATHANDELSNLLSDFNYDFVCADRLPSYKYYSDIADTLAEFKQDAHANALNNIVRTAVIVADRIVSGLSADELESHIKLGSLTDLLLPYSFVDKGLQVGISRCLTGFDKKFPNSPRNAMQADIAKKLSDIVTIAKIEKQDNIAVLQGVAGCGKTKIALEWALNTHAKKIIWVCPRVQICLGLLEDLTQSDYLPNSRIEIFTGEFKKILQGASPLEAVEDTDPSQYFSGDIVITTIDQVINNIVSHQKIVGMLDFMQAHVVFDEFHELATLPIFNLLFAELIADKRLQKDKANTLLISATPNYLYLKELLGVKDNRIITSPCFNDADYEIEFVTYDGDNPMINLTAPDNQTTFFISNTAKTAQIGFITHQDTENAILMHSKYTKSDKAKYFESVFNCFKQNGSGVYQAMRSSPVTQCSLNITCERMFTDITSAENWLQRLGRLDRFGKADSVNVYTTFVPNNGKHKEALFLGNINMWHSSMAWADFLTDFLAQKSNVVKLTDLYDCYRLFYQSGKMIEKVKGDMVKSLLDSVELIGNKVADPLSMPMSHKKPKGAVKIAKVSLRGDNRFVQLAQVEITQNLKISFLDEYAYTEDDLNAGLTESIVKIMGGSVDKRDSKRDLLSFMHKKHHQIKKVKASRFDWQLLQQARLPECPIYLSYTPSDLSVANCQPHQNAIYYVRTAKQTVGMMNLY